MVPKQRPRETRHLPSVACSTQPLRATAFASIHSANGGILHVEGDAPLHRGSFDHRGEWREGGGFEHGEPEILVELGNAARPSDAYLGDLTIGPNDERDDRPALAALQTGPLGKG